MHVEWVGFLGLMEIGILLAMLRVWSGSLWAPIVGHGVNNTIAGMAFLLGFQDPDAPTPDWVLVVGALLFALGVWVFVRLLRRDFPRVEEPAPRKWKTSVVLFAVWSVAFAAAILVWLHRRG
jgi:hypothetical protein